MAPSGEWLAYRSGNSLRMLPLDDLSGAQPTILGEQPATVRTMSFGDDSCIASVDNSGEIR